MACRSSHLLPAATGAAKLITSAVRIGSCLCALVALQGCTAPEPPLFEDITAASGVNFVHDNGMRGELWFAEMMGGGVASFDFDRDGDQDLLFAQGQALDGPGDQDVLHAVYRNDSTADGVRFTDVTGQAGIKSFGYAMGVATGDVNNDGWPDVYITAFGANSLWLNRQGTGFEQISDTAVDERWSVSASFADLDADGWLDLYVGNYVDYRLANHKPCRSTTSARDYCSPTVYPPQGDSLWRNGGADRPVFENISQRVGVARALGGALGVIVADFNGDRAPDIYVANDGTANLLWQNQIDGTFGDVAAHSGAAVNMSGAPEASMGLDAADFDGDGDIDLFMTHLNRESNTLYENDGQGFFDDRSATLGVAGSSLPFTGFGTRWADLDGDGDLDLFSSNGAVTRVQAQIDVGADYPLAQRNQFFRLDAAGYVDASADIPALLAAAVSRGLAVTDLNNDGAIDLVIGNNKGAPQLLLNTRVPTLWLGLDVRLGDEMRSAIGAVVTLSESGVSRVRRVHRDGSYASSSDPRIVFAAVGPDASIEVRWPNGRTRTLSGLAMNQYHRVIPEGT